ncbi:unnamed protein product, partial [Ixodes hexagonus]
PKKRTSVYCCVCECHNSYANTAGKLPVVQFYRFPGKPYEAERRRKWVAAVRRATADGDSGEPANGQARICSAHFVGNKKNSIAQHPAYIPTIFPSSYKATSNVTTETQLQRYQRLTTVEFLMYEGRNFETSEPLGSIIQPSVKNKIAASLIVPAGGICACRCLVSGATTNPEPKFTQTESDGGVGACSMFLSVASEGEASTQVSHAFTETVAIQASTECAEVAVGPDRRTCIFAGYDSLVGKIGALEELCSVSANVFALLLHLLCTVVVRESDVSIENRLLIFLVKLKLGISFTSIGVLFGVHRTTVRRIFFFILRNLSSATSSWIPTPSSFSVQATMPECFKEHYPRCRYIIDCTKVRTETPATVEQQRALFSHYKGCHTVKFLIAILPNGTVTFISQAYGGRTSDTYITIDSGFLEHIEPGDVVLADKGFSGIKAPVENKHGVMVFPPFSKGQVQFTNEEMEMTYQVARVRIHVERVIQRVKVFNILNSRVPTELISSMTDIVRMCCVLVNLQPPILAN